MAHEETSPGIATVQMQPVAEPHLSVDRLSGGDVIAARYQLEKRLGVGAVGTVWSCYDRVSEERLAIKLFAPSLTGQAAERKHLLRELHLARKVTHPNVCRVFDAGSDAGIYYLTMELVPGQTLRQWLRRGALHWRVGLHVTHRVLNAVAAAHREQVLHGDLKPENIMLRPDGHVVVLDFGLARTLGEGANTLSLAGTPQYMSPEQLRGESLDARSDVFSIGLLLREMLLGVPPNATDPTAPLDLPGLAPAVTSGLERAIRQALAHDRQQRPDSAPALAAALRQAIASNEEQSDQDPQEAGIGPAAGTLFDPEAPATSEAPLLSTEYRPAAPRLGERGDAPSRRAPATLDTRHRSEVREPPRTSSGQADSEEHSEEHSSADAESARDDRRAGRSWGEKTRSLPESLGPDRRYRLEEEHARGGAGRIVRARDQRLNRPVAVKMLLKNNSIAAARFLREAMVSAQLQHPSIVPIYDVGYLKSGEPFYTMKLISGRSLRELIDEATCLGERLALLPQVLAVADAMAYAHSHRIIHRDLKPANILIGSFGETVVIDWGLAKSLNDPSTSDDEPVADDDSSAEAFADLTCAGVVVGTPQYMPVEQAMAEPVDERVDVYSIGAILLHLLVGRPPYGSGRSLEVLKQVRTREPPMLDALPPETPHDLMAIVRKAMARKREERYPTARELADDLRRFLTGQLVSAHQYSKGTLLVRWLKRNRLPVLIAGACLALLTMAGGVSLRGIIHARNVAERALHSAEDERQAAQTWAHELVRVQARSSLDRDPTASLAWLKQLPLDPDPEALRTIALDAWSRGVARHVFRKGEGKIAFSAFSPDGRLVAVPDGRRALRLWDLLEDHELARVPLHGDLEMVRFSPDGQTLAFSEWESRVVSLWTPATGKVHTLGEHRSSIASLRFSPDGRRLLVSGPDEALQLWTLATGAVQLLNQHEGLGFAARFSPDGTMVAYPSHGRTVQVIDLETGKGRTLSANEAVKALEFSADGKQLAAAGGLGTLWIWQLGTAERRVLRGHTRLVQALQFSPDGSQVVSAGNDGTVRLWAVATGEGRTLGKEMRQVQAVAYSPDGTMIASGSADGNVQLFFPKTGEQRIFRGHTAPVYFVEFSHDQRFLMSVSNDRSTRIWHLPHSPIEVLHADQALRQVRFSPDGQEAVAVGPGTGVWLWRRDTGRLLRIADHHKPVLSAVFSPSGDLVASGGVDRDIYLSNAATGDRRMLLGHRDTIWELVFSPDGRILASASIDGMIGLWSLPSGSPRMLTGHVGDVRTLAISPDGSMLASGGGDATLRLWSLPQGEAQILTGHTDRIARVVFSNDGRRLASASSDGTVRLWSVQGGTLQRRIDLSHPLLTVRFSPDDRWVAAAGEYERVALCAADTGVCRSLRGHTGIIVELAFSPDGLRLASASTDGTVRVWDVVSGACVALQRHDAEVRGVDFSPDGKELASVGNDDTIRIWRTAAYPQIPLDGPGLKDWLGRVTSVTIASDTGVASP